MREQGLKFKVSDCVKPCIYLLRKDGEVVYVGSSEKGLLRALSHIYVDTEKDFDEVELIDCNSENLTEKETQMIFEYVPKYNKSVPSEAYISLPNFRQQYCRGKITNLRLNELRKLLLFHNLYPKGVIGKIAYYDISELQKVVTKQNE